MALTEKLAAIGNAIRAKTGRTEKLTLDQMPNEIASIVTGDGTLLPEDVLNITGNCDYKFYGSSWNWFINQYKDLITTTDITLADHMFYNSTLTSIPFTIDLEKANVNYMFSGSKLNRSPKLTGTIAAIAGYMFYNCNYLKLLDESSTVSFTSAYGFSNNYGFNCGFKNCYGLNSIPSCYMKLFKGSLKETFMNCYCLGELIGIPIGEKTYSYMNSHKFSGAMDSVCNTFDNCYRLANLTFAANSGSNCEGETLDLTRNVGYGGAPNLMSAYGGIPSDKEVKDDTTYQALKDDPNWYTTKIEYSRYNKTSAVRTINSLPDTSSFLANDERYAVNIIKFKGESGSATDGGAINTMSEEQIAVATAKGWTVSYV